MNQNFRSQDNISTQIHSIDNSPNLQPYQQQAPQGFYLQPQQIQQQDQTSFPSFSQVPEEYAKNVGNHKDEQWKKYITPDTPMPFLKKFKKQKNPSNILPYFSTGVSPKNKFNDDSLQQYPKSNFVQQQQSKVPQILSHFGKQKEDSMRNRKTTSLDSRI